MSDQKPKLRTFTGRVRLHERACPVEESTYFVAKYTKIVTTKTRIYITRQRELDCGHWTSSDDGDKRVKAHCFICEYPEELEVEEVAHYAKSLL
jgi:hypothetical protein